MRIIHPRQLPHSPIRSVADGKRYDTVDSALLIDATLKAPFSPISLPSRPYMEHALEVWKELKLPSLNLRSPWYGYSWGMWGPENQEEANIAAQGEHFQTGSKLERRRVPTPPGSRIVEVRRKARDQGDGLK